jgi:predicted nucleotidyltransferase
MESRVLYPEITESLLEEAVRRILQAGSPSKIVLFGSHARGEGRRNSDLDLLIVEDSSDLPRYKRPTPYRLALLGLHPSKDIVVWTLPEIERWKNVPNAFITTILREGRVLYERP